MSVSRKLPWLPIAAVAGFGVLCAALVRNDDPDPAWALLTVVFALSTLAMVAKQEQRLE